MTGIPTSEAVEPRAWPETFTAAQLEAARAELAYERAEIVVADLLFKLERMTARALPLPRRYTGGPLEDGVYLWRKPNWHRTQFVAMGVEEGVRAPHNAPRLLPDEWVWLIGPLPIPPIPESEEASS